MGWVTCAFQGGGRVEDMPPGIGQGLEDGVMGDWGGAQVGGSLRESLEPRGRMTSPKDDTFAALPLGPSPLPTQGQP